jgi:succinyl-CoA synthetase alpha subunit
MSILVSSSTKVITQGFTGSQGTFHSEQAIAYGTKMVGGVTPGKGRTEHLGLPVFDSVHEAVERTGADASVIYVPPPFAADSILEAIDAEVPLVVCITEGIPVLDMMRVKRAPRGQQHPPHRPQLPRRPHPRRMQDRHHAGLHLHQGPRRRRLPLRHADLRGGQADLRRGARPKHRRGHRRRPIKGMEHIDVLEMFLADPDTHAIIMIGEIGGAAEEEAAQFLADEKRAAAGSPPRASSPAAPRPRAAAWATPAPSSRAARATRSRRSRP